MEQKNQNKYSVEYFQGRANKCVMIIWAVIYAITKKNATKLNEGLKKKQLEEA